MATQSGFSSDVFWLQFDQGADTVNNFLTGPDKLQIDSSDFAGIGPTLEANELFNRLFDHDATGTDAQFVFQRNTQELWFHSEGTNTVTPVLIATIPRRPRSEPCRLCGDRLKARAGGRRRSR